MTKSAPMIKNLGFNPFPCCFILVAILLLATAHFSLAYEREINTLSISIAEKIAKSGKKTIAVVDFTDLQGNITELGRFLAEELSSELVSAGKAFEVVDRMHLRTILSEHKLSLTGLMDPKTVKKLGQISGVDAILIGTVTPFGESIRLSVKVLATDTAKIIGSSRGNIPKTDAIEELLGKGIETTAKVTGRRLPARERGKAKRGGPVRKVDERNFTFELLECKMSGKNVICHLLITNNGEDGELQISGKHHRSGPPSRMFDELGNIYGAEVIQLGNKKGNNPGLLTVSGIPVKAVIHFENVSPGTRKITLLELRCWTRKGRKTFRPQFRDVPLQK